MSGSMPFAWIERPGRRVVARRGEADRGVIADRDDGLHRALAEGARAEKRRALVILQRAGHDLRGRSRAAVDQHHETLALGDVAMARIPALGVLGVAAARRDDLALVEEGVADADRLIEQAARIVAQIEHIALELVVADILLQAVEGVAQILGRLLVELRDLDVADIVLLAELHALHLDDLARELQLERILAILAQDGELDRGLDRAAHLVDRLVQGEALHRLAVDLA